MEYIDMWRRHFSVPATVFSAQEFSSLRMTSTPTKSRPWLKVFSSGLFNNNTQRHCTAHNFRAAHIGGSCLINRGVISSCNLQQRRSFRQSSVCKNKKNYYDVLGVPKSATKDQIKAKYRDLAKKCHPDLNKDDKNAGTKFRELSEAYEVLENDSKRQSYDTFGTAGVDQNGGGGQRNPFEGFSGFGGFGGFGGFPGGGFRQAQGEQGEDIFDVLNRAMRKQEETMGQDVRMKLTLSFLEAVNGCNKEIKYDYMAADPKKSSQTIRRSKSVNIDIPPGVDTGVSIKMAGQGVEAIKGSHTGNLLIELQVEEDPYFQREGNDIYTDQQISMTQAAIGGTIDVLTLDGMVEMKVKAGTQAGTKMNLTSKGIKHLQSDMRNGGRRGNHYVKLLVVTPTALTDKQRALLEEFQELEESKVKDERCWTKTFSTNLDNAWSRLKSFTSQDGGKKSSNTSS